MSESSYSGIVLRVENPNFNHAAPYALPMYGKAMEEWVALAFGGAPVTFLTYDENKEIPEQISGYVENEYTVVLFSDTPLIQRKTVEEAIAFAREKELNVCRMTRGYIFKTDYIQTHSKIFSTKRYYFSEESDFLTASDFEQLAFILDIMRQRILKHHMANGVYFIDPATCYIDGEVVIGKNVTIYPNNTLTGKTVVKDGAVLKSGNVIDSSVVEEDTVITSSNITKCVIGAETTVGPYAYLRPECIIGRHCRIGDFVEIKKSTLGDGSKVSHLSYIGDTDMGKNVNVGCGCITANYDGKKKHRTVIGDNVFVGSNSVLIAPVKVSESAFIAAGSTINKDVDSHNLGIARARQVAIPDWNKDRKNY